MCWVNERDLVIIDDSNKLVEFKLDAAMKVCTVHKNTDLGFKPVDISCTEHGEIYMVRSTTQIQISMFNTEDGSQEQWFPDDLAGVPSIAINEKFVVLSTYYFSYVYNRDRTYVNKIGHSNVLSSPIVYLTTSDYSWYHAKEWISVSITHAPSMKTTSLSLPEGAKLRSLTGTSDGNVIASLFLKDSSDRFAVYSSTGTLLHYLQFRKTGHFSTLSVVSGNNWQPKKNLVALKPDEKEKEPILIYYSEYVSISPSAAAVTKPWQWLPLLCGCLVIYK